MSMKSDSGATNEQVLPTLHEAHGQRAARLDQHVPQSGVAGQLEPGAIGVKKDKAQVVDIAVVLAMLEKPRITFGTLAPLRIAPTSEELPHHAGEEAAGPIGPQLAVMMPAAARGVNREEIRRPLDRGRHLCSAKSRAWSKLPRSAAERFMLSVTTRCFRDNACVRTRLPTYRTAERRSTAFARP